MRKSLLLLLLFLLSNQLSAQTGHWEKLNPPVSPSARSMASMTSIGNRKALLFGGESSNQPDHNDTWIFDLDTRTWTELKPKNQPQGRVNHFICKMNENTALLFGGTTNDIERVNDTWIFNLLDTSWTKLELDTHPDGRINFAMTQIDENLVLLYGGLNDKSETKEDTWLFDLENKKWTCIDSALDWWNYGKRPFQRWDPIMASVGNRQVVLFSGDYFGRCYSDTWLFDLKTVSWKKLKTKGWIDSVFEGNGINLFGTKILTVGGYNLQNNTLMFDLFDTTWTKLEVNQSPPQCRYCALAKVDEGIAVQFSGTSLNDTWLFTADINGIDDKNSLVNDLKISPNPATDFIEITVPPVMLNSIQQPGIKIYNVFGEEVLNNCELKIENCELKAITEIQSPNHVPRSRIDVSSLSPGVYFVRVGEKVGKFIKI